MPWNSRWPSAAVPHTGPASVVTIAACPVSALSSVDDEHADVADIQTRALTSACLMVIMMGSPVPGRTVPHRLFVGSPYRPIDPRSRARDRAAILCRVRMSFGVEDEVAFQARCDELLEDFAGWLQRQQPLGADAGDARLALDWKWGYAGGDLATWTVEDLDEFLLE